MLEVMVATGEENLVVLEKAENALRILSDLMKSDEKAIYVPNSYRKDLLDALADQIVTATGVGTFLGMNVPGALAEVNRSNYSKFNAEGEPIFNENMKVMKGPFYTKPDLTPYV